MSGYLPTDNKGADLLFQAKSQRYERGSMLIATNKAFKSWPAIFNNDSDLTARRSPQYPQRIFLIALL